MPSTQEQALETNLGDRSPDMKIQTLLYGDGSNNQARQLSPEEELVVQCAAEVAYSDPEERQAGRQAVDELVKEGVEDLEERERLLGLFDGYIAQAKGEDLAEGLPLAVQAGAENLQKRVELPSLSTKRVLGALARAGFERVPGGKGSHAKIYNQKTGKTTTVSGSNIDPKTLGSLLKQVDIPPKDFLDYL